jgi:hypothetical protein
MLPPSILKIESPPHHFREFAGMSYHNQGNPFLSVQFGKELTQGLRGPMVESTGGFICEQKTRAVYQSAHDGGSLPFATGKLSGPVRGAFAETYPFEQPLSPFFDGFSATVPGLAFSRRERRHQHIFKKGALGQEVVRLKHETDLAVPHRCKFEIVQPTHVPAAQQDLAAGWPIQGADDLQEGALARSRWADDGERFTGRDFETNIPQDGERGTAIRRPVLFRHRVQFQQWRRSGHVP